MKPRTGIILHIAIWIVGSVFFLAGAFHTNIWFDESYTVGLMNHNLWEIIVISAADVHPPFYYILLKLYSMIFGKTIVSLRIFSVLCASIFAGLGFTHIRKDFGKTVGFWFTVLIFLFAATFRYANEIRMYTLAALLVALMLIYAYRYYKSGFSDKKPRVLFLIFSILSAYTHHYGLIAAAAVNFLFFWRKTQERKSWWKNAAIQLVAYGWGIYCLISQFVHVAGGFWIEMSYPEIIYETVSFFFLGIMKADDLILLGDLEAYIYYALTFMFWATIITIFVRLYKKKRKAFASVMPVLLTLGVIIGLIFAVSLISPLYYARYLIVISSLLFFFLAFTFDKIPNQFLKFGILLFMIVILVVRTVPLMENRYSAENDVLDQFIEENVRQGDVIVSANIGLVAIVAVKYPEIKSYFYNWDNWNVEDAYAAYEPQMETIRDLSKLLDKGVRIWLIDDDGTCAEYFTENSYRDTITKYETFMLPYHNLTFSFTLVE